jgi:hypothetical protein
MDRQADTLSIPSQGLYVRGRRPGSATTESKWIRCITPPCHPGPIRVSGGPLTWPCRTPNHFPVAASPHGRAGVGAARPGGFRRCFHLQASSIKDAVIIVRRPPELPPLFCWRWKAGHFVDGAGRRAIATRPSGAAAGPAGPTDVPQCAGLTRSMGYGSHGAQSPVVVSEIAGRCRKMKKLGQGSPSRQRSSLCINAS